MTFGRAIVQTTIAAAAAAALIMGAPSAVAEITASPCPRVSETASVPAAVTS